MAEPELLVDPAVSRAKFDREVADYRKLEAEHIRRGWWLLSAEFPQVFVVFAAPQLRPPPVVFGAILDFTNYDLWPPSVTLVNPFTRIPYKAKELPTHLVRRAPKVAEAIDAPVEQGPVSVHRLMQWYDPEEPPFICLPGVREYHDHPAHSGDSWLLHRAQGEGTLYFLLDKLYQYGVAPLTAYQIQVQLQMPIVGLFQEGIPE